MEEAAFEHEVMLYINPAGCIDCGLCVDECDSGAVFAEEDLPRKWKSFTRLNAEYYAGR
jgi:NAD-dependent dihydropyrimidine dehydrogenase PreA subunit